MKYEDMSSTEKFLEHQKLFRKYSVADVHRMSYLYNNFLDTCQKRGLRGPEYRDAEDKFFKSLGLEKDLFDVACKLIQSQPRKFKK